jgi:threonine synthase
MSTFALGRMSRTNPGVLRLVMDGSVLRGNETAAILVFDSLDSAKIAAKGRGPDFFVVPVGNVADIAATMKADEAAAKPKQGWVARLLYGTIRN